MKTKHITPYDDINRICLMLSEKLKNILGNTLIGIYLTGSLSYGDFNTGSSDIDFLIVLHTLPSEEQRKKIQDMHKKIAEQHPIWAKRIEASYITKDMLQSNESPKTPRPYVNEGKFWDAAPYGSEWLLNLYVLQDCGIALVGQEPKMLIGRPIDIHEVRLASKNDFYQEWKPLLTEPSALNDSHSQAYVILTLCRILHRAKNDNVVSKKEAAAWVNEAYNQQWSSLIKKAENWYYEQELNEIDEIFRFIRFIATELEAG
ncbi:MAG: DUF4111 domain-containing protein [Legionellales bacterium]|nr:DUF4111 domain-containing protein [Legionellales bacterium]